MIQCDVRHWGRGIFNAVLCRFIFLYREIKRIVILLAGNDRRKGKGDFMVENREEKSNKKAIKKKQVGKAGKSR